MKKILVLFLLFLETFLFSATPEVLRWEQGLSFTRFLEKEGLPISIYQNADNDDKTAIEDIQAGDIYYILRDDNGVVLQVLIPLSEELQAHIRKSGDEYIFQNIPIEVQELEGSFVVRLTGASVETDIYNATGSRSVARTFARAFENNIDFEKDIYSNSVLAMKYKYKMRLGKPFGTIDVQVASIQTGKKKKYMISYKSELYSSDGIGFKQKDVFKLTQPMKSGTFRISSPFTKKRWHPILHKYRTHLGTDYASPIGTAVYSAGNGIVVFAGVSSGYGNLIKIKHPDGYLTLYAHLHKFQSGIKVGNRIKRGEQIAFVGTSGLSTGPHLHFGLYKDENAIDPESINTVSIIKNDVSIEFKSAKNKLIKEIDSLITRWKSRNFDFLKFSDLKLTCETAISANKNQDKHDNNNDDSSNNQKLFDANGDRFKNSETKDGKKIKIKLFDEEEDNLELSEDFMSE